MSTGFINLGPIRVRPEHVLAVGTQLYVQSESDRSDSRHALPTGDMRVMCDIVFHFPAGDPYSAPTTPVTARDRLQQIAQELGMVLFPEAAVHPEHVIGLWIEPEQEKPSARKPESSSPAAVESRGGPNDLPPGPAPAPPGAGGVPIPGGGPKRQSWVVMGRLSTGFTLRLGTAKTPGAAEQMAGKMARTIERAVRQRSDKRPGPPKPPQIAGWTYSVDVSGAQPQGGQQAGPFGSPTQSRQNFDLDR
jgi:hypothetical protein